MAIPPCVLVLYGEGQKIEEILSYIYTYGVEMCDLIDLIHDELYKEAADE